MRINSKAGTQIATFDGDKAGEGLAIFLSQNANDVARYRFIVKSMNSQATLTVGEIYSSPPSATNPNGGLSRMIAAAVCPGTESWTVEIKCMNQETPAETAEVFLLSSKCCTAPVGASRVAERYFYNAGAVPGGFINISIPTGKKISSWTAVAGATPGSVVLASNSGDFITVPANTSVSAEPGTGFSRNETITFTNVDYFVEFLESA